MTLKEKIEICYQYFYIKASGNESFFFVPREQEKKLLLSFSQFLESKYGKQAIDINYLFNYFIFQFEYWYRKDTMFGRGKIMLNWCIGKKAFERWQKRSEHWDYFASEFARKLRIKKSDIEEIIDFIEENEKISIESFAKLENIERRRFHNQQRGFANCVQLTSLFDNKNKWCITCNFSEECKEILRIKFPMIYNKRYASKS